MRCPLGREEDGLRWGDERLLRIHPAVFSLAGFFVTNGKPFALLVLMGSCLPLCLASLIVQDDQEGKVISPRDHRFGRYRIPSRFDFRRLSYRNSYSSSFSALDLAYVLYYRWLAIPASKQGARCSEACGFCLAGNRAFNRVASLRRIFARAWKLDPGIC